MLPGKKREELTESFFPRCVLLLPTFWVVVVVVLLSHVSTQPQTQTHYYVKYNMQTQNLKPYNLKIQHMENVNRRYGVRSCFHLLLPAAGAQKKKKSSVCAILTPKQFPKSHHLSQVRPQIALFRNLSKHNFSSVKKWIYRILLKKFCSFYGPKNKTTDTLLVTTAYSSRKMGAKWGWVLVPSPASGSSLGKSNRGSDGSTAFPKTTHLSRARGSPPKELWRLS